MLDFGREVCDHLPTAERREWLVTDGVGGYASGTVAGLQTPRYHVTTIFTNSAGVSPVFSTSPRT